MRRSYRATVTVAAAIPWQLFMPVHREILVSIIQISVFYRMKHTHIYREKKTTKIHLLFVVCCVIFCLHNREKKKTKNNNSIRQRTQKANSFKQQCIGYCTCILLRNIRFSFALFFPLFGVCNFFFSQSTVATVFFFSFFSSLIRFFFFLCLVCTYIVYRLCHI